MNKNTQKQQINEIKKRPVNPFMKYKDVKAVRTDSSVDFNLNEFKEVSKKEYKYEKLKLFGLAASGLCAPLIATSVYMNHPTQIPIAIASITFATIGGVNKVLEKNESKKLNKNWIYIVEYSDEQKIYLFKKMYDEFEKHLQNGKKLVDNVIKASVVASSAIGVAVLTQMNSMKTFATGIAIGCCIYAVNKVLEHLGEKKAIENIEYKMKYDEGRME